MALVAIAQLLGGLDSPYAPFRLLYLKVFKANGWVQPNVVTDNPEPHHFAMLVGALFDGVAALALLAGVHSADHLHLG